MQKRRDRQEAFTAILCILTMIFGGFTVWSINGVVETSDSNLVVQHYNPVDPVVQGFLAMITIGSAFLSFYFVMVLHETRRPKQDR